MASKVKVKVVKRNGRQRRITGGKEGRGQTKRSDMNFGEGGEGAGCLRKKEQTKV